MDSKEKDETYKTYREKVIKLLTENRTWRNNGVWRATGTPYAHILPVEYTADPKVNRENRAAAIMEYLNCDCKKCLGERLIGLHQYAHHITSSQLLCMKFFSELIDDEIRATESMVIFMKKAFGIDIKVGADCRFEYAEKKDPYLFDVDKEGIFKEGPGYYEGTSFDFYINDGTVEVYFEIKFTEQGFKKENNDGRHKAKAKRYIEIAPDFLKEQVPAPEDFLRQYQIFRNIIRARGNDKFVVFISDENNPATKKDVKQIKKLHMPQNVIFKTWQEILKFYPFEFPIQLKAIKNYI